MSIKVLIADDSAYLRKAISSILEENKSIEIVDRAANGIEAIDMVKKYNPDVLVLDLLMPKMNGIDALKHIMRDMPTPTIILSSISPKTMDANVQALLLGAFDYIIKPGGLGAESLPEMRKQLIDKVIAASQSQIKRIYKDEDTLNRKISFRQELVSETFKFGKYLNKLEPILENIDKSEDVQEQREAISSEKKEIKEKSIEISVKSPETEQGKEEEPSFEEENLMEKSKYKEVKFIELSNKEISLMPEKTPTIKLESSNSESHSTSTKEHIKEPIKKPAKTITKYKTLSKSAKIVKKIMKRGSSATVEKKIQINSNIIVMGASVGGPKTLKTILKDIPKNFACPIVVVQHLNEHFVNTLTQALNDTCSLSVKMAQNEEFIKPGVVYIAPGNKHIEISIKNKKPIIKLFKGPPVHFCIPSIDLLFISAAKVYGNQAMGILLTGMGDDGVDGLGVIKSNGGRTIAESEKTAVLFGMPNEAAKKGYANLILPNYEINNHIVQFSKYFKR